MTKETVRTRQFLLLMALCSTACMLCACASIPQSEQKIKAERDWNAVRAKVKFRLASQQFESGLVAESTQTVLETLALDPTFAEGYVLLARAYLEQGRPGSAAQVIESARRADVRSVDLLYTEGVILEQREQFEEALAKFGEARAIQPDDVDSLMAQAECLVSLGRPREALALLRQHQTRLDDDGSVAALTAHVALLAGEPEEASARYAEALHVAADHPRMAEEFGLLLVRLRRYDEAVAVLKPLAEKAANDAADVAVQRGLAGAYLGLGDARSAKPILDDLVKRCPEDAAIHLMLSKAAVTLGDMAGASRAVQAAERLVPANPEVLMVRAVIDCRRGDYAAATSRIDTVLASNPADVEARCLLGEILLEQCQLERANEQFRLALKTDPQCQWAKTRMRESRSDIPPHQQPRTPGDLD